MENIKASILIANYNNETCLEECINSIKNQTYKNIEISFHDDFSSDESLKVMEKYENVKIIKNAIRSKIGSFNQIKAYERAFTESKGDIIFFLDSDDFFSKEKVKTIINKFDNNENLEAIFDLPILKLNQKLKYKKNKKKTFQNYWPYIPPQSCISIRRKFFQEVLNKVNFELFPDIWMDFRIALYLKYICKNFFILRENLTFYRQSPNMITSKFKFLSANWWKRRMQAHEYVKYFFSKNKIIHKKNLDYFFTSFLNNLIK